MNLRQTCLAYHRSFTLKKFKIFAVAALVLAATAASAGVTSFATYDYGRAEGAPYAAGHEAQVGVKLPTALGVFDVAAVGVKSVTTKSTDSYGGEVGYSLPVRLGSLVVTGRAGLGQVESAKYYSLAAEASLPLTSSINAFAGFRHRNGFNSATPAAVNRITVGADAALTKTLTARVGYARTMANGRDANGVTTALAYAF